MKNNLIIYSVFLSCCYGIASASETMQPGAWEGTMVVTAIHPKTGKETNIGNSRTTMCLTKEYLSTDPFLTATINKEKMRQKGYDCSISDYKRIFNSASWIINCTSLDGKVAISYFHTKIFKEKSKTEVKQVIKVGNKITNMRSVTESKYVGKCTDRMLRK